MMTGGGEMGERMRALDWGSTPLGPPEQWSQPLSTLVRVILGADQPMFISWGTERTLLYNDRYAEILGRKHPDALGRPFFDVWSEIRDQVGPLMDRTYAGESIHMSDIVLQLERHGFVEEAHFAFSYTPIVGDSGAIEGLFCPCVETTRQVMVDRQQLVERERLKQLFEQAPGFMAMLNGPEHVFEFVNSAYMQLIGHRNVVGLPVRTALPEVEGQGFFELLDRVHSSGEPVKGNALKIDLQRSPQGPVEERFVDLVYQPVTDHDGRVTGVFVEGSDVTDAVRAANELREVQGVNASILNSSRDCIVVLDLDGVTRLVSPGGIESMEIDDLDVIVGGSWIDAWKEPEANRAAHEAIARAREGGIGRFQGFCPTLKGKPKWWDVAISPILGSDGRPDQLVSVGREITEQKEAELALKELNDTLEERVQARQAELERAQESLRQSQKLEAVGQLTGGVAHDFNNLLTVIRGSIDLLRRPGLAEDRRGRYMDAISDTVDRAAKLTGQLLAFARRQALQPKTFDACRNVSAVGDMIGTLSGARVKVTLALPDTPFYIAADPSQFDTALVNMAVNARDAMDGEGELTIAVREARGIPALRSHPPVDGDFVAISLTDTGSGIASDKIDQIFEPFFTTKGVGHGTGLGLSQVFGFAKQSGGEVQVESELGEGSTFTLYLPRVAEEATASPAPAAEVPQQPVSGQGACVLVVEDNEDVGNFAAQTLAELGYDTVLAPNAAEALAILAADAERFDIVFSDVVMPGISGVELGHEIRRLHADLPVLLTSGYSHVLAETGSHGFELLQKPYSMDQLSGMLRKAAGWRQSRRTAGDTGLEADLPSR